MEDKTFELLTKMYSEFSKRFDGVDKRLDGVDNRLDGVDKRLDGVDNRLDGVESRLTKLEMVIENDIRKDISALYDGYQKNYEKLTVIERKVDDLSDRVDKQEVEIKVIKGGKS